MHTPPLIDPDFPAPTEGFVVTHLLIVADQDRSRDFYARILAAKTIRGQTTFLAAHDFFSGAPGGTRIRR